MIRPATFLVLLLAACASAPKPPTESVLPSRPEPTATAKVEPEREPSPPPSLSFTPVYFEFDSVTLGEEARRNLDRYAEALRRDESLRVTIEGHADERGSEEYNLALGERRAGVVRKYLRQSGVPEARLASVSFGEERPAENGSHEGAWSRNRRAELVAR